MVGEDAFKQGGERWGEDAKKRCQKKQDHMRLLRHAKELDCSAVKQGEHI